MRIDSNSFLIWPWLKWPGSWDDCKQKKSTVILTAKCCPRLFVDADVHKAEPAEDLHKRPGQAFLPLLHEVRSHKAVPVWVSAASRLVHPSPEHKAGGCGRVVSRDGGEFVSVHHSKWLSSPTFKSFRFNSILIFLLFLEKLRCLRNYVQCQILLLQKGVDMHHMTRYFVIWLWSDFIVDDNTYYDFIIRSTMHISIQYTP